MVLSKKNALKIVFKMMFPPTFALMMIGDNDEDCLKEITWLIIIDVQQ